MSILELRLAYPPCNEIGSAMLERFEAILPRLGEASALLIHSDLDAGFCAGADLRELHAGMRSRAASERSAGIRDFLDRIHAVFNAIDAAPIPTIAAVHGVVFGGGFELALACDLIVADKTARFAFPELRLGLVPGFGGIPRLRRDCGNALVRDLLLTGRSINAQRAQQAGIVSQVVGVGNALKAARVTAEQMTKFDAHTVAAAKEIAKPIPQKELKRGIDTFCRLFKRPEVERALRKFVESDDRHPYLP